MAVGILFFVLAGCVIGIFTGLIPGLHVNTIAAFATGLVFTGRIEIAAMMVGMGIVHTFVDFIPSVLLGAPSEESFLSVLPGQRLFMQGRGHYAVSLTVWGGVIGGAMAIAVSPLLIQLAQKSIAWLGKAIPFILIGTITLMLLDEKGTRKKAFAVLVIGLAAALGIAALAPESGVKNPLLVLVTGFFGAAPLLHSLKSKPVAKKQFFGNNAVEKGMVLENSLISLLGAGFVSMLPGIGPSQAALVIRTFVGKIKASAYLVVLGGINTANMFFSIAVLYAIGKTRTGIAVAVKQLIVLEPEHMVLLASAGLIAIGIGAIATIVLSKSMLEVLGKMEYGKISIVILAVLAALVIVLSNMLGIMAFATAAAIGFGAMLARVKRSHCMAFLMVPTILYYLNIW